MTTISSTAATSVAAETNSTGDLPSENDYKFCKACSTDLPVSAFNAHKGARDGLQTRCTNCRLGRNDPIQFLKWRHSDHLARRVRGTRNATRKTNSWIGKPLMAMQEFVAAAIEDPDFKRLWTEWKAAGYPRRLCPTPDRIDTTGGYTADNIQWVTVAENSRRGKQKILPAAPAAILSSTVPNAQ